jgi:hypothetical protein
VNDRRKYFTCKTSIVLSPLGEGRELRSGSVLRRMNKERKMETLVAEWGQE